MSDTVATRLLESSEKAPSGATAPCACPSSTAGSTQAVWSELDGAAATSRRCAARCSASTSTASPALLIRPGAARGRADTRSTRPRPGAGAARADPRRRAIAPGLSDESAGPSRRQRRHARAGVVGRQPQRGRAAAPRRQPPGAVAELGDGAPGAKAVPYWTRESARPVGGDFGRVVERRPVTTTAVRHALAAARVPSASRRQAAATCMRRPTTVTAGSICGARLGGVLGAQPSPTRPRWCRRPEG